MKELLQRIYESLAKPPYLVSSDSTDTVQFCWYQFTDKDVELLSSTLEK